MTLADYDWGEVGSSSYDADLDSESFDNPSDVNVMIPQAMLGEAYLRMKNYVF